MPGTRRRMLLAAGAGCAVALAFGSIAALATPPTPEEAFPGGGAGVASGEDNAGRPTIDDPSEARGDKISICHRTGSARNPYVVVAVDAAAIVGGGPGGHGSHGRVGNGPIADIIPPFDGYPEGKNWAGQWEPGAVPAPADCTAP
jgi:hypothetical protein